MKWLKILKFKYIKWRLKNYGPCAFSHRDWGVYYAEMSNCIYKCDRCGETWKAY